MGFSQNISFAISTQKGCGFNQHIGNVSLTVNGKHYATDQQGTSGIVAGPVGTYYITASTPELPDTHIAWAEYWVNGVMAQKFIGDGSGAIAANLNQQGNLFLYLACDQKKIKIRIATTKSCSDNPNEGFSAQGGVTVSIGDKTFTSNTNGVIEAEISPGNYAVNAIWKDYALGYISQNGLSQRKSEDGNTSLQIDQDGQTLEVRMFTCEPGGQAKARATVTEIGEGSRIRVKRSRTSGNAFPGMQLRDGDTITVSGKAKLTWLDGNATISFEDPLGSRFFIIGPEQAVPKGIAAPHPAGIGLLEGLFEFMTPHESTDPADKGRFQASNHTIICGPKGTRFKFGYDRQTKVSTVMVSEGEVYITPVNPSLKSFTLIAGQQVQVGETFIGPVAYINSRNMHINLSGTWSLADGQAIRIIQTGNQVTWSYSHGGKGHEHLTGNVSGSFDGKNFTGIYHNREGTVTSSGMIDLILNGNRLEGNWHSTNPPGQSGIYTLIRN